MLIPLTLGLFLYYLLDPIVAWMEKRKIPRTVGAALLLVAIVIGAGYSIYALRHQGEAILEQLPRAARRVRQTLQEGRGDPNGTLSKVQKAASEIEKTAQEATNGPSFPKESAAKVEITEPALNIRDYIWVGTVGIVGATLQTLLILFLVYFLLISGKTFRRRMVKISGPSPAKKRKTVEILNGIDLQVKRFMLVQLITSLFMGAAVWLAFRWIGLENAGMWGIVAGVLKSIPFLGGAVIVGGTALVGYLQFGTLSMAFLIGAVSIALKSLEGLLVSPLLTSKTGEIHTVWVFVGILFWGWVWGVWGLLLGIPIIMIAKAVSDRVDALRSIGEILGN